MNKETIVAKKAVLETEFKKVAENRQKAQEIVAQCTENLMRLQGAFAQLTELEKELEEKPKEIENKPLEKVE